MLFSTHRNMRECELIKVKYIEFLITCWKKAISGQLTIPICLQAPLSLLPPDLSFSDQHVNFGRSRVVQIIYGKLITLHLTFLRPSPWKSHMFCQVMPNFSTGVNAKSQVYPYFIPIIQNREDKETNEPSVLSNPIWVLISLRPP